MFVDGGRKGSEEVRTMRLDEVHEYLRRLGLEYEELREADGEECVQGRMRRLWNAEGSQIRNAEAEEEEL